ncbi:MAG TPA: HigA family addiction module antitoxin [Allosphingosinicella sp.]|nr:HigA family addiction module antitoxin [Allosphingosinicella sp.]
MTDKLTKGLRPTHPGEILREDVLPALSITKTRFAELLRVSRQTLYDLLGEKQPVTPQMALRLGRLLGNGPEIWLRLQGSYDLATQAEAMAGELEQIETLKAA